MNEKVRKKIHRLVGERCARAGRGAACNLSARGKRRRMAMDTTNGPEAGAPLFGGRRGRSRSRRGEQAHEISKTLDVRDNGGIGSPSGCGREVERVIRGGNEKARGSLVPLLREQLIRDSHFHVVGFGREQEQGLVLRLPPKARDCPIVCGAVYVAA